MGGGDTAAKDPANQAS